MLTATLKGLGLEKYRSRMIRPRSTVRAVGENFRISDRPGRQLFVRASRAGSGLLHSGHEAIKSRVDNWIDNFTEVSDE
jgi:hypothetical protein